MAAIKCKMCGGDLTFAEGATVAECEYCGSKQTIPNQDNEKKLTLFARADRLRRACEFDKAAGVYESIVADFPEEAEAYWGLVLCRYGIEYVDDPATGKKIPTCHRSSFDSILEDTDFDQACENADVLARKVYRDEAKQIEDIRKGILEVSGKEEPYDIFICYKETDENGDRTVDSVIAQDVYDALTEKGYRVFFSRISLEDKLGTEYEPYIFAALNSAKIMLAFGTDYEHFNAVWVKNEWSRFLALIATGQKKTLIPCYKGVDAYDMPKEFQRLQAQDMGKVGAIQDLLRGIDKIMGVGAVKRPQEVAAVQNGSDNGLSALLKRGYMALEDGEWDDAAGFFNRVLDMDAESAPAYLGMAMAQAECRTEEWFRRCYTSTAWSDDRYTARAKHYASPELQKKFEQWDAERAATAAKEAEIAQVYAKYRERSALAAKRICAANFVQYYKKEYHQKYCVFGVRTDGTVVNASNGEFISLYDVNNWSDIVTVAARQVCTIGLKSDGTVIAADSRGDWINVGGWTDIAAIAVTEGYTSTGSYAVGAVGLKSDGTVVANGKNIAGICDTVAGWTDIVAIAAGNHTVGLKSDGTVVVVGNSEFGECNVGGWTDIVAIAACRWHTFGLKSDGTVVAAGDNQFGERDVGDWTGIVAIAAGGDHTVGLRADGTVVAVGDNRQGQCDVSDWTDIVAVAACRGLTVGLKADNTVVNTLDPALTRDWRLSNRMEHERVTLEKQRAALQAELNELKGVFAGLRRREIESRLAYIDKRLKNP